VIGVVDYGMGNLHSVEKALQRLQASAIRLSDPIEADHCRALLLPGVGAFDPAMQKLNSSGWSPVLQDWAQAQRPLLGICLGLQVAVIEFARNILNLKDANSSEFKQDTKYHDIICFSLHQKDWLKNNE